MCREDIGLAVLEMDNTNGAGVPDRDQGVEREARRREATDQGVSCAPRNSTDISTITTFKRGATLLLRDSLPAPDPLPSAEHPFDPASTEGPHVAITNHKEQVYERVGPFIFSFAAGSFFQNNNSILIPLTDYVKQAIFPPGLPETAPRPTHLVDTYCGSGLFGITLSPEFQRVAGVEISADSIVAAKKNAEMNGLGDKTTWLCGKAEDIFGGLAEAGFAGDHSCVVIDVSNTAPSGCQLRNIADPSLLARDATPPSSSNYSPSAP